MARCGYRLVIKIVVLLIVAQLLSMVVYKRFEYYGWLLNLSVEKYDRNLSLPLLAHDGSQKQLPMNPDTHQPFLNSNITLLSNNTNNSSNLTVATTKSPVELAYQEIKYNVSRMFNSTWSRKINQTFIDEFKKELMSLNIQKMFILSQDTVKQGEALHFSINVKESQVISKQLFQSLPKEGPFFKQSLQRCSVVGSGGILTNSRCGVDIDKAQYIFRCNAAPVEDFSVDAGSKTNMTTLNPSVVWRRYHGLRNKTEQAKFLRAMQAQHADILLPLFGIKFGYSTASQVIRIMKLAKKPPVNPLIMHPKLYTAMQNFWKERGIQKRLSTGFYLTSVAIALCKEVYLYGFWPFPTDMNGYNVSDHYYESQTMLTTTHDFPIEFRTLLQLHQDGIVNLQIRPCEPNDDR